VVSAMSGVTDGLLRLAGDAAAGRAADAHAGVAKIHERHIAAAADLAPGNADLVTHLTEICQQLDAIVTTLGTLRETTPRMLDVVAAAGELLSSRLVAAALTHAGLQGKWVDARRAVITTDDHMRATPLTNETNAALRATVGAAIEVGRVPVIGGFVGATADGHTTTLGRGGSDYSAFNFIMTGTDTFACEGTSWGTHQDGSWRAGVTHAGRWCDVFEVRDFLIQRCFIYLDPDYAGLDTARYPWLSVGGRDPSKPMG